MSDFYGYGYQGEGASPHERLRQFEEAAQYARPAPPPLPPVVHSPPVGMAPTTAAAPQHDGAEFDFETASEAGHVWNETTRKWVAPAGAKKKGLSVVGASVYSEHPTTRVLTLSYKLPPLWLDAHAGVRQGGVTVRWRPGLPAPQELFDYLAAGHTIEAFNVMFERLIWENVCVRLYGWPSLEPHQYQLRCAMAKARVNSRPGRLADLGEVLNLSIKKDAEGKRLLDKFSVPRNPTQKDPRTWITPEDDPADFEKLQSYCDTDIATEAEASAKMHPLSDAELFFWLIDQEINWRGVGVDRKGIRDCIAVLEQALTRYGEEFRQLTGGLDATQLQAARGWLAARGVHLSSMDAESVEAALKRPDIVPHPPGGVNPVRRILEIRELIGSASVKKLYAMELQGSRDDRLRNLIVHHGARTGRPTGEGPQPLNLPKAGPDLLWCGVLPKGEARDGCRRPFRPTLDVCPWCNAPAAGLQKSKWSPAACDHVLDVMGMRSLELVEWFFGDAVLAISGCIRGLFQAGDGCDLIASDYSAIEAVVTAMLAGEEWRIQTFRDKKDIYLMSAAKITGRSAEEYEAYALANNGEKHPDRQKIGKVAELALGFGGWIGAWRNFDDTDTFSDDDVRRNILAWRDASPRVVEMWGGQSRGRPWDKDFRQEYYGFEGMAVQAIQNPGLVFEYAGVQFYMRERALIIRLLSGRELTYHDARLTPSTRAYAAPWELSIVYWTWNTNPEYGPMGWVCMSTYSAKLTENIVQAIAHDILRFAIINLRAAGYPTVLHVYDEIVGEIPIGTGSIEEFERIMATLPPWAHGWPVRADGGWRGKRYRKG